jgi:hypothetical protein
MATQWAIQLRPTALLKDSTTYPGSQILAYNPEEGGLYISITEFIEPPDPGATGDVLTSLENIARTLSSYSNGISWNVISDGGQKAISLPQQDVAVDGAWYLNLCCLQSTLGVIASQIWYQPDLAIFRNHLFPDLQIPPYSSGDNNLGAWHIKLKQDGSPLSRQDALIARTFVIREIDSWSICLAVKTPGDLTFEGNPDDNLIVRANPSLLPGAIYPPSGEWCQREQKRPTLPFPPGSCVPPGGQGSGCYFPVKGYPACCFSRTQYPLLRGS